MRALGWVVGTAALWVARRRVLRMLLVDDGRNDGGQTHCTPYTQSTVPHRVRVWAAEGVTQ